MSRTAAAAAAAIAVDVAVAALGVFVLINEKVKRKLVEADNVKNHAPHARGKDATTLAEEGIEICAGPFKDALIAGDAKGHFRGFRLDAHLVEEVDEVGYTDFEFSM